jgi:hypothetical protein
LGIAIALKTRGARLFYSLLSSILGFLSYHGAKLLFLPVILILIVYRVYMSEKDRIKLRTGAVFITLSAVFLAIFILIDTGLPGAPSAGRLEDLYFFNSNVISSYVNEERRLTIDNPLKRLFSNKAVSVLSVGVGKYFEAFDVDTMLLSGDQRATYRFETRGLLYLADMFFILLGLLSLYKKRKKLFFFLLFLILVSPIPTAVSAVETSVIFRSFLLLPLFVIAASWGVVEFYNLVRDRIGNVLTTSVISLIYLLSFFNFTYFYFFRFPVSSQENFFLSERVLSRFVNLNNENLEIVSPNPRSVYLVYLFYTDGNIGREYWSGVVGGLGKGVFEFDGVLFTDKCPGELNENKTYIVHREIECNLNDGQPDYLIQDQKDSGAIFKIFNSNFCNNEELTKYRRSHTVSDYAIESMEKSEFCNRWINI